MTVDRELFHARHVVFLRKSREAARQSLLFLGLLEKTNSERVNECLRDYSTYALHQVRALVDAVHVHEPGDAPGGEGDERLARALAVVERWRELVRGELAGRSSLALEEVRSLEERFHRYLDASAPTRWRDRLFAEWLPRPLRYLQKNLALILATLLALAATLGFEMFRGLFVDESRGAVIAVALLALPHLATRLLIHLYRRRDLTPSWDVGGDAFRSFRYQPMEPAQYIQRWPAGSPLPLVVARAHASRFLAYLAWFAAVCALFRVGLDGWVGETSLTIFVILGFGYALMLLARLLDFWDFLDPRPVRLLGLYAALGYLVAALGFSAGAAYVALLAGIVAIVAIFRYLRTRQKPLRLAVAGVAVGLVAFALWERSVAARATWSDARAGTAERPAPLGPGEWPHPGADGGPVVVLAASSGGSRAALYTALTLERLTREFPHVARRVEAVSAVSGGSLATAAYVAGLVDADGSDRARAASAATLPSAVTANFTLPTLLGALTPGITRGERLQGVWRDDLRLGEHRLGDLTRQWRRSVQRGDSVPPFPVPLFNAMMTDGHDFVLSPLGRASHAPDATSAAALYETLDREGGGELTWVYFRDGVYALEDLLDRFDPPLSASVLASASAPFPFVGFPFVEIRTRKPLYMNPAPSDRDGSEKVVQLTDGAILSSSGMWSLFHLLMNRAPELRERGVLLLVVDAAFMPPAEPVRRRAMVSLSGTIEGYVPKSQFLHRQMYSLLQAEYGHRLAIVQLDLVPRARYNVPTTWALSSDALARVRESFDQRWNEERASIPEKWALIQQPAPPAGAELSPVLRPPLD